jgi:hypothetical protein
MPAGSQRNESLETAVPTASDAVGCGFTPANLGSLDQLTALKSPYIAMINQMTFIETEGNAP